MTPDLIIFDCDGVLIDSEVIASQIDAEELTRLGYPITADEMIRRYSGVSGADMYADIERRLGRALPADIDDRAEERMMENYRNGLDAIPYVRETLQVLPWRRCVASSSRPVKLSLGLIQAGLFEVFYPHIFSTVLVERGKPAPDLFLFAARQMNASPDRCVVVEDSVAGVRAAKAAGMRALGFVGGSHCMAEHAAALRQAGAEIVLDRFDQLPTAVQSLS